MYYYIFDPPVGAKEYERTAQIKELLGNLGIAGEMTQPQPGKTAEDLVHTAITKRYSTIVAVGGMDLINQVAQAIEPYEVVFGIIPTLVHPDITELIGTSEWQPAAEQLKRRRWQPVQMAMMNEQICFLTPACITLTKPTAYTITTPTFRLEATAGNAIISITPRQEESGNAVLHVDVRFEVNRRHGFFSSLLRRNQESPRNSHVHGSEVKVRCDPTAEVSIAGTMLTTTPIHCTIQKRPIRLIVNKAAQGA